MQHMVEILAMHSVNMGCGRMHGAAKAAFRSKPGSATLSHNRCYRRL